MITHRFAVLLLAFGGASVSACAMKSDIRQVQTDIALFKAEAGRRDSARAAQLSEIIRMQRSVFDSLQVMGRTVSRFKGDLGTDLYNIQQQLVQLQELTGQSQRRLSELRTQLEAREAQAQIQTAPGPAPAAADTGSAPRVAAESANQMYETSLAQLQRGSSSTARAGLQELLRTHPESDRVPDALYFIGQSFAAESPDSALVYYQQVVDRYTTSPRAPSALYNIGLLAERQKDKAKARETYQRVVEKYPRSAEADLARERLKTSGR